MTGRGTCVPLDRLTALAMLAAPPDTEHDRQLLAHVNQCDACAQQLAELTSRMDSLREAAWQEADARFDDTALEAQRNRILQRLAHLGKAARVLRFPGRVREAAMPVSPVSRRWISVAAAAGLIIGLVAGQIIHLVPWEARLDRAASAPAQAPARSAGPVIVQASSTVAAPSDEELMDDIDEAMQLRRAATLRALDAFTPRVGELTEIR